MKPSESLGYKELSEMRSGLANEQIAMNAKIREMRGKIEEIDLFIETLLQDEEVDIRVFTPRNLESRNKPILDEKRKAKEELLLQIEQIEKKKQVVEEKLDKMDAILAEYRGLMEADEEEPNTGDVSHETLLLSLLEDERARIANELHDDPIQELTAIIHKTELCGRYIQQDPIRAQLELATISKSLKDVITECRRIIYNLRPLVMDDLGWEVAVRRMLNEMQQQTSKRIVYFDSNVEVKSAELIQITSYRIVQEAVMNAIKHSEGTKIEISVGESENTYIIKVFDNGDGFNYVSMDPAKKNFGLQVMQERAQLIHGELEISPVSGEGTLVKLTFPK